MPILHSTIIVIERCFEDLFEFTDILYNKKPHEVIKKSSKRNNVEDTQ